VNIGDYEHRDVFISHSTQREPDETLDEAYKRAMGFVRTKLHKREKRMRSESQEFVDFDTNAKLP